jgi:hypothetical protein
MKSHLRFALVSAAAAVCVLGTTMQSQALNCQRGSFTSARCYQALEKQIGQAQRVEDCLKAMEAEYSGRNGAAGAGRAFDAKKRECARVLADLNKGVNLDEATPEAADVNSAVDALSAWAGQ